MRQSTVIASLAASVSAQGATQAYMDATTGISFQTYTAEASRAKFGIAMPAGAGSDFIGQITAPSTLGWASGNLGPSMIGKMLLVAWPSGQSALGSVRIATTHANPAIYPDAQMVPIPQGTYNKADSWQLTFLCKGCLNGTASFDTAGQSATFAWAASKNNVAAPLDITTPLNYHTAGEGQYSAAIQAARSDKFDTWAAMAGGSAAGGAAGSAPSAPAAAPSAAAPAAASAVAAPADSASSDAPAAAASSDAPAAASSAAPAAAAASSSAAAPAEEEEVIEIVVARKLRA